MSQTILLVTTLLLFGPQGLESDKRLVMSQRTPERLYRSFDRGVQRIMRQTSSPQPLSLLDLPVFSRGDRPSYMDKTLGAIFSKVAFASAQPPNQTFSTTNPRNEVLDPVEEIPQPPATTTQKAFIPTAPDLTEPPTTKTTVFDFDTRVFDFVPFERLDPNNSPGLRGPTRVNLSATGDAAGTGRDRTGTGRDRSTTATSTITLPTTTSTSLTTPLVAEPITSTTGTLTSTTVPSSTSRAPRVADSGTWQSEREVAWGVQIYGTAALFMILGIFVLSCLFQLRATTRRLLSTSHCLSIQLLVLFLAITRSIHLLYDPYNHRRLLPPALAFCIFNVAFPCLSSALAVLLLGIFKATKIQSLPSVLVKPAIWAFLVAFHFALSLSIDIVVGSVGGLYSLHLASQAYFVLWSLALSLGFFAAYGPVTRAAKALQAESVRASLTTVHIHGAAVPCKMLRPTLMKAVRVTLAATIFTVLLSAFQLYGMFGIYGLPWRQQQYQATSAKNLAVTQPIITQELLARYKEKILNVDALREALGLNYTTEQRNIERLREVWPVANEHFWPWWTYQFIARVLEFLVAILLAYAASRPQRTLGSINTDVTKPRPMWIFAGKSFKSGSMETLSSLCCQTNKITRTRDGVNQDLSPVKPPNYVEPKSFSYANPSTIEHSAIAVPLEYSTTCANPGSLYGSRRSQRRVPTYDVSTRHIYQELEPKGSVPSMTYYSSSSMASSVQYYEPQRYEMQTPNAQLLTLLTKESKIFQTNVYGNRQVDHLEESQDPVDRDPETINQEAYLSQCTSTCSSESAGNSFDLRFFARDSSRHSGTGATTRSSLRIMEPTVYPLNTNFHRSLPLSSKTINAPTGRDYSPDSAIVADIKPVVGPPQDRNRVHIRPRML